MICNTYYYGYGITYFDTYYVITTINFHQNILLLFYNIFGKVKKMSSLFGNLPPIPGSVGNTKLKSTTNDHELYNIDQVTITTDEQKNSLPISNDDSESKTIKIANNMEGIKIANNSMMPPSVLAGKRKSYGTNFGKAFSKTPELVRVIGSIRDGDNLESSSKKLKMNLNQYEENDKLEYDIENPNKYEDYLHQKRERMTHNSSLIFSTRSGTIENTNDDEEDDLLPKLTPTLQKSSFSSAITHGSIKKSPMVFNIPRKSLGDSTTNTEKKE